MIKNARRPAWTAVPLYQPFFLLIIGPLPALGLALWNSFQLRAPDRWVQVIVVLVCAAFASGLIVYAGVPAANQLSDWTGLPIEISGGLVKTLIIFMTGLVIASLTLRQLESYRARLFHGPVPTDRLHLMIMFSIFASIFAVAAHRADLPLIQQSFIWRSLG
jgi:hypothetical protein